MIYDEIPEGFNPVRIAVCIIMCGNQILLLRRAKNEVHPGVWSLPSGKIEQGEDPEQAIRREIIEECGFAVDNPTYSMTLNLGQDGYNYTNYIFKQVIDKKPDIQLDLEENDKFEWFTLDQIEELDKDNILIFDELSIITMACGDSAC